MFGAERSAHFAYILGKLIPNCIVMSLFSNFERLKGLSCADMYQDFSADQNTRLNSEGSLAAPFARTNLYKNSIRVEVRWKSFPVFMRQCDNYNHLKIIPKQYLLNIVLQISVP